MMRKYTAVELSMILSTPQIDGNTKHAKSDCPVCSGNVRLNNAKGVHPLMSWPPDLRLVDLERAGVA